MHNNLILEPKVTRIAITGDTFDLEGIMDTDWNSSESEDVVEFAGRACYQSFHKPNPATESNKNYIANIIKQGHESVLEHAQATFYIEGVSRTLTHELVRHRHFSYSQMSQRYVNESDAKFVVPPRYLEDEQMMEFFSKYMDEVTKLYGVMVEELQKQEIPRKQAREATRSILPGSTETKIVVSGNLRTWRDFLKKRMHPTADAEIQRLSLVIFDKLHDYCPHVFEDLKPMAEKLV